MKLIELFRLAEVGVAEDSVDETNLYYSNKAWINLAAFNVNYLG